MKIISKVVKDCKNKDWSKTKVLEIDYSHKGETWKILIKDFLLEDEENVIKQLHKHVKELYNNKDKWFELDEDKDIIEINE